MNKRSYQQPCIKIYNMRMKNRLMTGSVRSVSGGNLNYGGGGHGAGRSRDFDLLDDEE